MIPQVPRPSANYDVCVFPPIYPHADAFFLDHSTAHMPCAASQATDSEDFQFFENLTILAATIQRAMSQRMRSSHVLQKKVYMALPSNQAVPPQEAVWRGLFLMEEMLVYIKLGKSCASRSPLFLLTRRSLGKQHQCKLTDTVVHGSEGTKPMMRCGPHGCTHCPTTLLVLHCISPPP